MASLTRLAWSWNRSWRPSPSEGELFASVSPNPAASFPAAATPELDLLVLLTTYERPAALRRTLEFLRASMVSAAQQVGLRRHAVVVLDDASSSASVASLEQAVKDLFPTTGRAFVARDNQGKRRFWRSHALLHRIAKRLPSRNTLFLQDDLEFDDSMVSGAWALWNAIPDRKKRVLNLFRAPDEEEEGRWIRFARRPGPIAEVEWTQWFDLPAFWVGPSFFRSLGYRVYPIPESRWERRPNLSSGVGEQYTLRIGSRGRGRIYQVRTSLVRTGREDSIMNPEARKLRPLRNL